MAEFDLFKVKVIDRYSSFLEKGSDSHQSASIDISRVKNSSTVLAVPVSKSVNVIKKKD